jgi:hypothetical protein
MLKIGSVKKEVIVAYNTDSLIIGLETAKPILDSAMY